MAAGVVPKPVTLRRNDHLRAELDAVNAMLHTWRDLIAQVQQDGTRLHESLALCRDPSTTSHADPAAGALWADIVRTEQHLHETLGRVTCEVWPDGGQAASLHAHDS
jgi:hypothetical protein